MKSTLVALIAPFAVLTAACSSSGGDDDDSMLTGPGKAGAPDCRATVAGASCKQKYDVGVFSAQGLGGQFVVVHPGLDLVLVAKNYSGQGGPMGMWNAARPALVALDPMFMGDEEGFCKAYGAGDYAPDLLETRHP